MSKLQTRPEPLARKLSMLKLHLAIPAHAANFAQPNFAVSGTKTLGSQGKAWFWAACCSARGVELLSVTTLSLESLQRNLCQISQPREPPQLRIGTKSHFAT